MNISALCVFQSPYQKIRLGKDHDGGYVICDGLEYDCFLSGGIAHDASFERDFLRKNPYLVCNAYDGSIGNIYLSPVENIIRKNWFLVIWGNVPKSLTNILHSLLLLYQKYFRKVCPSKIIFKRKYIGGQESGEYTNLHTFFDVYENIMVKMDIEGAEFEWLESLSDAQLQKIQQLIIEFHKPFDEKKWQSLSRLGQTHWLVHFHPNNHTSHTYTIGSVEVPYIFECTYIRKTKSAAKTLPLSQDTVPGPLDQKNVAGNKDIVLTGFPYNSQVR